MQPFHGIHRSQQLRHGRTHVIELETDLLADTHEPVGATGQAVLIHLESMSDTRLHDAGASGHFGDESVEIGVQLWLEMREVMRDDPAEENSTEPR
jgi:hypothetical protein